MKTTSAIFACLFTTLCCGMALESFQCAIDGKYIETFGFLFVSWGNYRLANSCIDYASKM